MILLFSIIGFFVGYWVSGTSAAPYINRFIKSVKKLFSNLSNIILDKLENNRPVKKENDSQEQ